MNVWGRIDRFWVKLLRRFVVLSSLNLFCATWQNARTNKDSSPLLVFYFVEIGTQIFRPVSAASVDARPRLMAPQNTTYMFMWATYCAVSVTINKLFTMWHRPESKDTDDVVATLVIKGRRTSWEYRSPRSAAYDIWTDCILSVPAKQGTIFNMVSFNRANIQQSRGYK